MKIVLFAGGWSSERAVSLQGAIAIQSALEELGHCVIQVDPATQLTEVFSILSACDFAFVNIHGTGGEDGLLPALLEYSGCPYQCSSPIGSFLALNKTTTKMIYTLHGLPTSRYHYYTTCPEHIEGLSYPLFIKANTGGSSLGLFRAVNEKEALHAIQSVLSLGDTVLVEEGIAGKEVTCGVLGELVLPPVLIQPKESTFFDYTSKYTASAVEEICPAPLSQDCINIVQEYALKAHTALQLSGYSRTDMIIQEDGTPIVLETNTIPGMTPTSLLPLEAKAIGIPFGELLERLIELGIQRHATRNI